MLRPVQRINARLALGAVSTAAAAVALAGYPFAALRNDDPAASAMGVLWTMSITAGLGLPVALVTSGDRARVERELRAHGLDRVFRVLVCGPDTVNKKPHPEPLLLALRDLGVPPRRAVYVGDSPEDIEMARTAGAWSIGIPGGFPNALALERARPDLLAPRLAEAVDAVLGGADR